MPSKRLAVQLPFADLFHVDRQLVLDGARLYVFQAAVADAGLAPNWKVIPFLQLQGVRLLYGGGVVRGQPFVVVQRFLGDALEKLQELG